MKRKSKDWLQSLTVMTLAALIRSFGTHCFILPNAFAPGGFTGVGALVEYATGFSAGYTFFLLNIPALIFAFFALDRNLAIKSAFTATLNSAFLVLLKEIDAFTYVPEEKILAAIAGGIFTGLSLALVLKVGGSFAGTDIFGTAIQRRYSTTNVAYFIFMLDSTAVLASFFVYKNGLTPVILALTNMFVSSKTCDLIISGSKSAIKFEVVTSRPEELSRAIMETLHRGVTKMDAVGMYTQEEHAVLVCILRRRQVTAFRRLIKEIDPDAFAYMSQASEVLGKGFVPNK